MKLIKNIGEEKLIVGPDDLQDLAGGPQNGAGMSAGAF